MKNINVSKVSFRPLNKFGMRPVALMVVAASMLGQSAWAANPATTSTWNAASGNWGTGTDWLPATAPASSATNVFEFDASGTGSYTVTNNVSSLYQVNGLRFNTTSSGAITIANSASDSISLVANGGQNPFIELDGTGNVVLGALTLSANTTINGTGSGTITQTNATVFSGGGSLTMAAASGTITLAQTNTFSGGMIVDSGVVNGTTASALGTGSITLGNTSGSAAATLDETGAVTQTNNITVAAGNTGVTTLEGTSGGTYSGTIALNNNLTVDSLTSSKTQYYSNTLTETSTSSPALTITKGTGAGTVDFTGAIVIGSGGLTLANSGAGGFSVADGLTSTTTGNLTLQANSTGTINLSTVSVNNAGTILNNGSSNGSVSVGIVGSNVTGITEASAASQLTLGTLNVASGGTTLTSTGAALFTVTNQVAGTGNLVLNANSTGSITLTGGAANTGTIINSGSGSGTTTITGVINNTGSAGVTSVTENSANSELVLSGANTFTGGLSILNGTVLANVSNATGSGAAGPAADGITLGATGGSNSASLLANSFTVSNNITLGTTSGALVLGNNGGTTAAVYGGSLALGSKNLSITAGGTGTLTESGTITGSGTLTLNGTGTVVLNGTSPSFSGNTSLSTGQLDINSTGALGSGTLLIAANTTIDQTAANNPTISNAETWNGSFNYLGQSQNTTLGGAISMPSAITLTVTNDTLTVTGAITGSTNGVFDITKAGNGTFSYSQAVAMAGSETAAVNGGTEILSGVISGSGDKLTKTGTGTLVLTNTDTYSGGTLISGGTLQVGSSGSAGVLGSGGVTDNGVLIYSHTNNFSESNAISGTGSVVQAGTGTVTFTAGTTYTGGTTINAGVLAFSSAPSSTILINAAGSLNTGGAFANVNAWLASGDISANSTGDIALTTGTTTPDSENISFSGYNNLMLGATVATYYTGTITPASSTYRLGGGGSTLTLTGTNQLTGSNALVVGATNASGTASTSIALTGSNNMTGATTVVSGTLTLGGSAGALGSSAISVDNGASLTFASTTSFAGTARAASVVLNGPGASALNVTGNSTANSNDTISGALSIGGGATGGTVVTLTPNAAKNTELTAGSFSRSAGSLVLIRGTSLGSAFGTAGASNVAFTTTPTLTGGGGTPGTNSTLTGIIVGAFGDTSASGTGGSTGGGGLLTYDPADGVRLLTTSEYATSITSGATTLNNVLYNSTSAALTPTITSNTTINSLSLTESGTQSTQGITLSGSAGTILTINSGMIFASNTLGTPTTGAGYQSITVPYLNFGSNEGILISGQTNGTSNGGFSGGLYISSVITGSAGLTIGGGGYTELAGVNTYTGTTTVDLVGTGRLILTGTGSAGNPVIPGNLIINGGTVVGAYNYAFSTATNLTINSGGYTGQTSNSGSASYQSYASLTMNGGSYSTGAGNHNGGFALSGAAHHLSPRCAHHGAPPNWRDHAAGAGHGDGDATSAPYRHDRQNHPSAGADETRSFRPLRRATGRRAFRRHRPRHPAS